METPDWVLTNLHPTKKPRKNGIPDQEPNAVTWYPSEQKTCSHCDKTVWQDSLECRKSWNPRPHWRVKCNNCKFYLNYQTGKFDLAPTSANNKIIARLRDK